MRKRLLVVTILCGLLCATAWSQRRKPDRIRETKTITATFVGFEAGDYLHAILKRSNGERVSFFLMKPGIQYFLLLRKDEPLELTYQVVDTYIPEAGDMETIKRLVAAKASGQTYAAWWKDIRTKFTMAQLRRKYDPLVEASTIEP
jgi:hypothetical protein